MYNLRIERVQIEVVKEMEAPDFAFQLFPFRLDPRNFCVGLIFTVLHAAACFVAVSVGGCGI